jgi:signal transduction histidine kinase
MRSAPRLTIRTRLTLWYAAVFIATGAVLLTTVYLLARQELFSADVELTQAIQGLVPAMPLPTDEATRGAVSPSPVRSASPMPSAVAVAASPELAATIDASRQRSLRLILAQSGVVFAVMAAVALLLSWLVASRALRPLRTITTVAEQLSHDTLQARITYHGPRDELRTLADSFNTMLDRLARAFQAQRLFAANASHELRTPLTVIQTAAEKALSRASRPEAEYRRALGTIVSAAHRSERLLSSLLALAQLRQRSDRDTVDLAVATAEAVGVVPRSGPRIQAELVPATVAGDPVLIELLVRNLLDNAARYNVDSGAIWLRTTTGDDDAVLRVANTGPAMTEADLDRLRQPFHRGSGRTGTDGYGLGLAIVDAIVDAHNGHWTAAPRLGGGLTVEVHLPLSSSGAHVSPHSPTRSHEPAKSRANAP